MKILSGFGIFLSIAGFVVGQELKPTSVPLESTQTSLLANGKFVAPPTPVSNFRTFIRYGSEAPAKLKIGEHEIDLPPGDNATVDLTHEHLPGKPATIHLKFSGDPTARRIEVPDSVISQGGEDFDSLPGKDFRMDQPFTLAVRFETTRKNGTLAARTPAEGKWKPDGKTLYLNNGRLTYDIGWFGEINGGPDLADGKAHLVVLNVNEDGEARLFADGKQVSRRADFTSEDDLEHVFKIGETAEDFGGDFGDGKIHQVVFWKRALAGKELTKLTKGDLEEVNTPDFHWKASAQKSSEAPGLVSFGARPGYAAEIDLQAPEGFRLDEAWVQPLEVSDHQEMISSWGEDSLKRGREIYQQLCVTCHGTPEKEGSIPIALKFHEGQFKNGSDPFRMFQTLTKGYGMMMPMPQYSTQDKYDVIHYIREEYLAKSNKSQLAELSDDYLSQLPRGMSMVEEPKKAKSIPPYKAMDFGNVLFGTYQIEPGPINEDVNIAQKGIAIRLDPGPGGISKGKAWAIYDHDTMRLAAIYTGDEFVDWKGIDFDGSHGTHTSIVGKRILVNDDKPGWAHPETGSWEAERVVGKDGRKFGPLPKDWVKFEALWQTETGPALRYKVGDTEINDRILSAESEGEFLRFLQIAESDHTLKLRIKRDQGDPVDDNYVVEDGSVCRVFPPSTEARQILFYYSSENTITEKIVPPFHTRWLRANPPTIVTTEIERGDESGPFAVDVLTVPVAELNPHQSWMRTSGFDFYPDGKRAAVCTWMGDVWIVEGIDQLEGKLTWKRICSGLFQPLGLKIIDDKIHVTCRDQLAKLHDQNGDETIDYIECLNNDHQVTEHFHEFAMGLQTDDAGNFYYAKSARHAKDSLIPHHGTLLRISPDGSKTDILATGFRAANGVCLNPDGTFIVTDQEGHWNPKNRINWVNGDGPTEFFGNIYGYSPVTDTSDSAMKNPLCWITNSFDRSPSELLWVPKDASWGSLNGQLLNLSYGYGKIYVVPHEKIGDARQGGLCELPLKQFPTGIMRGRFHPQDGQLYGCGMFAWAGTQRKAGGFYRIRKTEASANLPVKICAKAGKLEITLSEKVQANSVKPAAFQIKAWDLKRTKNYGSRHFNERSWAVAEATLADDGKTLVLGIPELEPTWGMSIEISLTGEDGESFRRVIHNSIFELGK